MTPFRFIGDADTALGFRLAGVPGDIVTTREDALEAFSQALSDRNLVVLVMTEQVAESPWAFCSSNTTASPSLAVKASLKP